MNRLPASAHTAERFEPRSEIETRLHGYWLVLVRLVCLTLGVVSVGLFVASIPSYFASLHMLCKGTATACNANVQFAPGDVRRLQELGLSIDFYATYIIVITSIFALGYWLVAALLFWRKSDNPLVLLAAVSLGTFPIAFNDDFIRTLSSPWWLLAHVMSVLGSACIVLFFYVFPSGHFVPRWTCWVMVPTLVYWVFDVFFPVAPFNPFTRFPALGIVTFLGIIGGMVVVQVYRYRRVSTATERQQTKWVVYGITLGAGGFLLLTSLGAFFPSYLPVGSLANLIANAADIGLMLLLPLSIGFAVLRARLWDIDILINRTLVYALLTASTLGLYVLVVFGASSLLRAYNDLVFSLLATALIAVLFQPLRQWLQYGVNHLMFGERNEPYRVLSRLGQRLEETLPADTVLPTVAETVARALKLPYVAIVRKREQVPVGAQTLLLTAAFGTSSGSAAETRVPLVHQGKHLGELVLSSRQRGEALTPADMRLVRDLAPQIGMALHSALLLADLQQAREQLITTREEERRRLRRDLHDGLGPALASLTFKVDAARNLLTQDSARVDRLLGEVRQQAQEAITDIRQLVYNLRPPALDELGLLSALREQAAHYRHQGLEVDFEAPQALPPLPAAIEVAVYRIAQEALTNIAHHADARHCLFHLSITTQIFHLDISDDGQGIAAGHHVGVGLHAMHERASELGGSCTIAPGTSGGTLIQVRLPLVTVREALPTSAQEPGQLEQE